MILSQAVTRYRHVYCFSPFGSGMYQSHRESVGYSVTVQRWKKKFTCHTVTAHCYMAACTTLHQTYFNNQLNAQFLYSLTICMLHYNTRHVSIINMPVLGGQIVLSQHLVTSLCVNGCTVCRIRADCGLLSSGILYSRLHRVTIPDAVIIKFVLLKMEMLMLETCRGL